MRKNRLLIIGCGDVLIRALPWLTQRFKVYATARSAEAAAKLRELGVIPVLCDLDHSASLKRLSGLARWVVYSAPPAGDGADDVRCKRFIAKMERYTGFDKSAILTPRHLAYISTSGVYGDCKGEWVAETRPLSAQSARAIRRVAAESCLKAWARSQKIKLAILRAPGIYAKERLPVQRIMQATPALIREEDSWSNHIHADDLARAVSIALFRGKPLRAINVADDQPHKMGDYFDQVADFIGQPHPPRIKHEEAPAVLSASLMSFLNESRRLKNTRLKKELRLQLKWPATEQFLQQK
ncbi:NAD-dependent epimerase/dehydratase family protein [Iodobacter fluviatilis]|uniref:Nucleoside-diphosphate-sugar epimerase n=1 Tax=Iodobacter fluviatilis TaxID=537 RepID=A0A377Q810_9NEIS|nr:NAD-dependent epimerase/dehydratase family protein [Iodobacter fluviatilis]TCU84515.1 nucleoside-diphosphate-sugar epimerase [Iodobacter fluviatilis]STQ89981.1 dTDP-glucose 4,6-dehydratase [Iodobacter fluviatilis]